MPLPCSPCGLQAGTSSWGSLGTCTSPAESSILRPAVRVANVGDPPAPRTCKIAHVLVPCIDVLPQIVNFALTAVVLYSIEVRG